VKFYYRTENQVLGWKYTVKGKRKLFLRKALLSTNKKISNSCQQIAFQSCLLAAASWII